MCKAFLVFLLVLCISDIGLSVGQRQLSRKVKRLTKNLTIEAFSPSGLIVTVPHVKGVEAIAFHGNINARIVQSQSGGIVKNGRKSSSGDDWIIEDDAARLQTGDIIHFFLKVQIDGDEYTTDRLYYVIKGTPSGRTEPTTTGASAPSPCTTCKTIDERLSKVESQLNATLAQINSLNENVAPIKAQVENLTELLLELVKNMEIGTKLLLVGELPPRTNPVETVRQLITEKLQLMDLDDKILQATNTENGILFEMSSAIDKKRILYRAETKLANSHYKIVDPDIVK